MAAASSRSRTRPRTTRGRGGRAGSGEEPTAGRAAASESSSAGSKDGSTPQTASELPSVVSQADKKGRSYFEAAEGEEGGGRAPQVPTAAARGDVAASGRAKEEAERTLQPDGSARTVRADDSTDDASRQNAVNKEFESRAQKRQDWDDAAARFNLRNSGAIHFREQDTAPPEDGSLNKFSSASSNHLS